MSLSVNGSNQNNPFALQALWQQQASSASGTQAQSDPLSQLLAQFGQQGTGTTSTASGTGSTVAGTTATPGSSSPQFGSQTLQALLALQTNGSNAQSLASQFGDDVTGDDPLAALQSQSSQGGHHHHHHHMGTNGSNAQTTGGAAGASNSSTGSGSGTGTSGLNQWLQMQAQLTPPAVAQELATA
jgi:hypothetical protein